MNILKEKLGNISGGRILDVATGDGSFINLLINNLKDYTEVIGIDSDIDAIEQSRRSFQNNKISFALTSGNRLEYEDTSFDTVAISNSLHHLGNIDETLNEMLRVLRPGGTFIINELFCDKQNEKQLTHTLFHHLQAEVDSLLGITHNKTLKKQEIIDIANSLQFKEVVCFVHENEMFNKYVRPDKFADRYRGILDKLSNHAEYDSFRATLNELIERLNLVGVEFSSQVMIIGEKY